MSANVIPSAPHDQSSLYPQLPPHDFRMQKANEVAAALNAEVVHYRGVAKKYKRAKKIVNLSATGCGFLSAVINSKFRNSSISCGALCLNSTWRSWWCIRPCFIGADSRQ